MRDMVSCLAHRESLGRISVRSKDNRMVHLGSGQALGSASACSEIVCIVATQEVDKG